jgi:hypothetical protein
VEFRELERVADVILVGVRAEHVVAGHAGERDAAVRVFLQIGIEDEAGALDFDEETGMAEGGEAHDGGRTRD